MSPCTNSSVLMNPSRMPLSKASASTLASSPPIRTISSRILRKSPADAAFAWSRMARLLRTRSFGSGISKASIAESAMPSRTLRNELARRLPASAYSPPIILAVCAMSPGICFHRICAPESVISWIGPMILLRAMDMKRGMPMPNSTAGFQKLLNAASPLKNPLRGGIGLVTRDRASARGLFTSASSSSACFTASANALPSTDSPTMFRATDAYDTPRPDAATRSSMFPAASILSFAPVLR